MLERLSPIRRNIGLGVIALALVWFSWTVRTVLNPLILGYILACILNPMVRNLERVGWGRRAAANLIFIAFFVMSAVVGVLAVQQGRGLTRDLLSSDFAERVQSKLPEWAAGIIETGPGVGAGQALFRLYEFGPGADQAAEGGLDLETVERAVPHLRDFFGSVVGLLTLLFLLPIYAYFLLFELERIHGFVHRYTPARERERFARIGLQIGEVLASFFRGRLTICLLKGLLITAGLAVARVDYAVLLGMGSGALALIPFVGPLSGFLLAFLVALVGPDQGFLGALLSTGLVFGLAEFLEGYVLMPKILGDSLGLHPVVVLASVFVGGAALGMFGLLIAVPTTAVLVILVREMVLPALGDFADENGGPDDAGLQAG